LFNVTIDFFKLKTNIKISTKQFFEHRYARILAKSALAEEIELPSLSGRVW